MKTMTKTGLAILVLGASTWVIIAQQPGATLGPGAPGEPVSPGIGRPAWPGGIRPSPPVFRVLDANHDGVIDAEEIANAPAALRSLLKDGKTTLTLEDLLGQPPMFAHGPDGPVGPAPSVLRPRAGSVDMAPGRPGGPNGPGGPGGPPSGDQQ